MIARPLGIAVSGHRGRGELEIWNQHRAATIERAGQGEPPHAAASEGAVRFYVVTFTRQEKSMRLGATSAMEALKAISSMKRDGWIISRIERGTETIAEADLDVDAKLERARAH